MHADEARSIALKAQTDKVVPPMVSAIKQRIVKAAQEGKTSINDPLKGITDGHTYKGQIRIALEADGYRWTDHPDPDPGHPASRPYTEVSWA